MFSVFKVSNWSFFVWREQVESTPGAPRGALVDELLGKRIFPFSIHHQNVSFSSSFLQVSDPSVRDSREDSTWKKIHEERRGNEGRRLRMEETSKIFKSQQLLNHLVSAAMMNRIEMNRRCWNFLDRKRGAE